MTEGDIIVANILINLVYTLLVLLLPFAIYRGIKGEPISPKKAHRIVVLYMIVYSALHIGFSFIFVALGMEVDGSKAVPNFAAILLWSWIDKKILSKGYDIKLLEYEYQFGKSVLSGQYYTPDKLKKQKAIKKHYPGFIYNKEFVRFISRITEVVTNVFTDKESAIIPHDFFDTKANEYHYRILVFSIFQYHCNLVSLKVNYKKCATILSEFCGDLIEKSPYEDGTKIIKPDIVAALCIKPFTPEKITEYYLSHIIFSQASDQLKEELNASFDCFFEMLKQGSTNYPDEPELIRALLLKSKYYYHKYAPTSPETSIPTVLATNIPSGPPTNNKADDMPSNSIAIKSNVPENRIEDALKNNTASYNTQQSTMTLDKNAKCNGEALENNEFIQRHSKKTAEQNIALFSNISAVVLSIVSILGIILAMNFQDSRKNLMESWNTTTVYFVLLSLFCIFLCFSIISLKKHSFKLLHPLSYMLIAATIIAAIDESVFSHSFYNLRRYVYDNNDIVDIFNAFWVIGSILIFVITLLPIIPVVFKNVKSKWHKSIRYRERCYKRVSKLHRYFKSGIITEEEFLSAKNDIIKNIER